MSNKNKFGDAIRWGKAYAQNGIDLGYSCIEVNGLTPFNFKGGEDRPESMSTSGRLVLWLGDDENGKAVYGYFDAARTLDMLKKAQVELDAAHREFERNYLATGKK